jgi:predicted dehydrogenase
VLDSETDFRLRPAKVLLASEGGLGWLVEVRALLEGGADIWAIVGEEHLVSRWQREDRDRASRFDIATHYHRAQIEDFLDAICEARLPLVPGEEGRKSVEIAAAIYKSQAKRAPVRFPVVRGADGPTRTAVMA